MPSDKRWQERLLPWMKGLIVALAAVFFAASAYQLWRLENLMEEDRPELASLLSSLEPKGDEARSFDYLRWKALLTLEMDVVRRRYHQATTVVMARVWTRYVGFLTGMVLALSGAGFILGKLREPPTELSGEAEGVRFSLATSSPGIVLAVLGTVLMSITLLVPFEIETRDVSVYLHEAAVESSTLPSTEEDLPATDKTREPADNDEVKKTEKELFKEAPKPK